MEYERDPSRRTEVRLEQPNVERGSGGEEGNDGAKSETNSSLDSSLDQNAKTGPTEGAMTTAKVGTMSMSFSSPLTPKFGVMP